MFCSNCGKALPEGSRFCTNCGAALAPAVPEAQNTPAQQPTQQDSFEQQIPEQSPAENQWPDVPQEPARAVSPVQPELSEEPASIPSPESIGMRVLRIALSAFLALLLFVTAFSALLGADIRMALTEDSLNNTLSDISLEDIPLEQILEDELDGYDDMADWLEDVIYEETHIRADISQRKLEQFLDKSTVLPFLSEKMSAYCNSIFSGTYREEIDRDEIVDLVMDNTDLLEDVFDVVVLQKDAENIGDWFESSGTLDSLSLREMAEDDEVKSVLDTACVSLSYFTLGGVVILAVVMLVLIFVVNKKNLSSALYFAGIPLIISGGLLGLLGPLSSLLSGIFSSAFGNTELVGKLVHSVFTANWIPWLVVLAVGIVSLALGILLKKLQSRKNA